MAVTVNLKPRVDLPVYEWLRPNPSNSVNGSSFTTFPDASTRYLYFINSNTANYRYDVITDSWDQVATPINAATNNLGSNSCYSKFHGHYGRAISSGGGNNIGIGMCSLMNIIGTNNVAIGNTTLMNSKCACSNIAIGDGSLFCFNGNNSIAIGTNAGKGLTNTQANNTIIINSTGTEVDGVIWLYN